MRSWLLEVAAALALILGGVGLWALPTDTPIVGRPPLLIGWALIALGIVLLILVSVARMPGAWRRLRLGGRDGYLDVSRPIVLVSSYEFGHLDDQLAASYRRSKPPDRIQMGLQRQADSLYMLVTNAGPTAAFEIQVLDIQERDDKLPLPWFIPWETGSPRAEILAGQVRRLELVRFDRSASHSMWNGHATGGPFIFPDASRPPHHAYCDSVIANNAAEMRLLRVCMRLAIFRVEPPARLEARIRFGFFQGADDVILEPGSCTPSGGDAIRAARAARVARLNDVAEDIKSQLVAARFGRLALREGEQDQIVQFLLQVGLGHIAPTVRLAVGTIHLDDGSTEDRLRPEDMFHAAAGGVALDIGADGTDRTLRLIQSNYSDLGVGG